MVIETPIPLKELEEIHRRSEAGVSLKLIGVVKKNGIPLNRVLIEGEEEEIKKFMESLMRARAGG